MRAQTVSVHCVSALTPGVSTADAHARNLTTQPGSLPTIFSRRRTRGSHAAAHALAAAPRPASPPASPRDTTRVDKSTPRTGSAPAPARMPRRAAPGGGPRQGPCAIQFRSQNPGVVPSSLAFFPCPVPPAAACAHHRRPAQPPSLWCTTLDVCHTRTPLAAPHIASHPTLSRPRTQYIHQHPAAKLPHAQPIVPAIEH